MRNVLIAVFAIVLVVAFANAQTTSSTATDVYTIETAGTGVTVSASAPADITDLQGGYTYTVTPLDDGTAILTPADVTGNQDVSPFQWEIDTDPFTNLTVSFVLPTVLVGTLDGAPALHCSFGPQSLIIEGSGAVYNPNVANTIFNTTGTLLMDLGITVTIPPGAVADAYTGNVTCQASITGL